MLPCFVQAPEACPFLHGDSGDRGGGVRVEVREEEGTEEGGIVDGM